VIDRHFTDKRNNGLVYDVVTPQGATRMSHKVCSGVSTYTLIYMEYQRGRSLNQLFSSHACKFEFVQAAALKLVI
jgi:hypothetical protein